MNKIKYIDNLGHYLKNKEAGNPTFIFKIEKETYTCKDYEDFIKLYGTSKKHILENYCIYEIELPKNTNKEMCYVLSVKHFQQLSSIEKEIKTYNEKLELLVANIEQIQDTQLKSKIIFDLKNLDEIVRKITSSK